MAARFRFGELEIDGHTYTRDLIILPGRVIENWWRKEGHSLCMDDLAEVPLDEIEVLVVGTGAGGAMHVPDDVRAELERHGIEVIVQRTADAVQTFERLRAEGRRVAGAFHLTC